MRGFVGLASAAVVVPKGFRKKKKEVTLTLQRYVIIEAQKQWTASVKVKIDLC